MASKALGCSMTGSTTFASPPLPLLPSPWTRSSTAEQRGQKASWKSCWDTTSWEGRQLVWETPSLCALCFRKGCLSKSFTLHPLLGGEWACFNRALLWGSAEAAAGAPRLPPPEAIVAINGWFVLLLFIHREPGGLWLSLRGLVSGTSSFWPVLKFLHRF